MESPSLATREFVFESLGKKAYVEVSSEDTLAKVRKLILEELDSHQFPSGDDTDFGFEVNGIGISTKQETKKNAFALLDKDAKVELIPRSIKRKISPQAADSSPNSESNNERGGNSEAKRRKLNVSNPVTPSTETNNARRRSRKSNYMDMGGNVCIPRWYDIKKVLLGCGYKFGTLLPNANGMVYARPFGGPGINPSAKLGEDYFIDVASFRAHLCAYGLDYLDVDAPPTPEDQHLVNRWCRYSIASDYATPNANTADFKLHAYQMHRQVGQWILRVKLGFKYKDKGIYQGYQWPGETQPHQLMSDNDLWIRLARFGLPKGLPLEKLESEQEVLALLLCIAKHDLERPIQLNLR